MWSRFSTRSASGALLPGGHPGGGMKLPGLIDLIGLAVTLAFALPVGMFGLNMAVDGRPIGFGLIALAVLMVVLPHYLWRPPSLGDIAGATVGRLTGKRDR